MTELKLAPVTVLPVATVLDIDAERVLTGAAGELATAIVIGYHHDGSLYFASSITDPAAVLWAIEKAKAVLMRQAA